MKALKRKWIDGECRHMCFLCDVPVTCDLRANILKKLDSMLPEAYDLGRSYNQFENETKQYDKGWHDCYEFYKHQINAPKLLDYAEPPVINVPYKDEEVKEW